MGNELKSSGAGSWKAADSSERGGKRTVRFSGSDTLGRIATGAQSIQKRWSSNEMQTSQLNKQLKPTLNYFSDFFT